MAGIPLSVAEEVREQFIGAEYVRSFQQDPDYYSSVGLGMEGETYTAQFGRAEKLEVELRGVFEEHIRPVIGKYGRGNVYLRAYKMTAGDHFRLHTDDLNPTGFIWYLSKGWRIDWGGLLIDDGVIHVPEFNKLVVREAITPHLVTEVAPWAREPRYMLAGWL